MYKVLNHIVKFLIVAAGSLSVTSPFAWAALDRTFIGTNGQHARPFYNFAHNPNALEEIGQALDKGANALEPDVMRFSDTAYAIGHESDSCNSLTNCYAGTSGLFMYHDYIHITTRIPLTVEKWLDEAHIQVKAGKNLALIAFDIKSQAASYLSGDLNKAKLIQTAVNDHLNYDGVNVNIIYSVGTIADSKEFFKYLCLKGNEGVMVDSENGTETVIDSLLTSIDNANTNCQILVPYNFGFSNGSLGASIGLAPRVLQSIDLASWLRATSPENFAIPYAFPISTNVLSKEYIYAGVDGLIPDADKLLQVFSSTLLHISGLNDLVVSHPDVYPATAGDNPFKSVKHAYGLSIPTLDNGTDAKLTFTLTGVNGSASVTIDSSYGPVCASTDSSCTGRMEAGHTDYVTIQSKDLGQITSMKLSSDGSGYRQEWAPGKIKISSDSYQVKNCEIDFTGTTTDNYYDDVSYGLAMTEYGIKYAAYQIALGLWKACDAVDALGVCGSRPTAPAEPLHSSYHINNEPTRLLSAAQWNACHDSIAPHANPVQSPPANSAGWNNSDVGVTWNWVDNVGGSGIDPANCTLNSMSSGEGSAVVVNATCKDKAGNLGTATRTVKVDKTPPHANPVQSPPANSAGWNNSDVGVTWNWVDNVGGSGIDPANCTLNSMSSGEGSAVVLIATCKDKVGNQGVAARTVKVDKTLPTIIGMPDRPANIYGWYKDPVAISFICSDSLSGMAMCSQSSILSSESANLSLSGEALDIAGNSNHTTVSSIKIDRTLPTVTYTGNVGNYTVDQTINIACLTADNLSGIAPSGALAGSCIAITGPAYSFALGNNNFSDTTTDRAGNTGSGSTSFYLRVTYDSLANLTGQFLTGTQLANAFIVKLINAKDSVVRRNFNAATGQLNAYIQQVKAQTKKDNNDDKALTQTQADILIRLAQALLAQMGVGI